MEYETLTGAEIQEVIAGKPPSRTQKNENASPRTSSVPKAGASKAEFDQETLDKKDAHKADKEKEKLKAGMEKVKSNHAKSNDSVSKRKKSPGAEKKTQSTKKTPQAANFSGSKENTEKDLNAAERKGKQEPKA